MPYGIDKKLGGDNPSNTKFMEKCVKRVMTQGYTKGKAIAICKSALKKKKNKK